MDVAHSRRLGAFRLRSGAENELAGALFAGISSLDKRLRGQYLDLYTTSIRLTYVHISSISQTNISRSCIYIYAYASLFSLHPGLKYSPSNLELQLLSTAYSCNILISTLAPSSDCDHTETPTTFSPA